MNILDHGFVTLRAHTNNPGGTVVDSARCSFGSSGDDLGEKDQKLIAYLLGHGHTSPFRHAFFTFHVKAPLFVFRQWWKYQVGSTWREYETETGEPVRAVDIVTDSDIGCSWNELSGRYKVMEPEFYVPEHDRQQTGRQSSERFEGDTEIEDSILRGTLMEHNDSAVRSYNALLQGGTSKELARLVLPPSIYSEAYWTVSLQAILHFLDQRLKPEAQWEIRQYASAIMALIRPELEKMGIES
tara:strand:+ start:75 stop:800 length:726 start_codon:yes stop_codon:yes gene_type:complete